MRKNNLNDKFKRRLMNQLLKQRIAAERTQLLHTPDFLVWFGSVRGYKVSMPYYHLQLDFDDPWISSYRVMRSLQRTLEFHINFRLNVRPQSLRER